MNTDFGSTGAYASAGNMEKVEGVECNVASCTYNQNRKICTAGKIKVGPTNATCTDDTICATFRPH
jgi:hypothetical protein